MQFASFAWRGRHCIGFRDGTADAVPGAMTPDYWLGGLVALGLFGYLLFALINPRWF